jgi:ABC-type transporter lipoprotein component MlaA
MNSYQLHISPCSAKAATASSGSRARPRLAVWGLAALVVALAGCAPTYQQVDWSRYQGPGADAFRREEVTTPLVDDPLEPLNRGISAANHALIIAADPLARAYRFVVPHWVRERVRDFGSNLVSPRRLLANLLQGNVEGAGTELARFTINTSAGVLGFFDPATRWGYEASDEDFGQVFARWGWLPSTYLVLPLIGPSSLRDSLALAPDTLLDPAFYFFPSGLVLGWNERVEWIDDYRNFVDSSADPYADARLAYQLLRNAEVQDFRWEGDDTAAVQSLEVVLLGPKDDGFSAQLSTGSVVAPATGSALPFSYRLQPAPAPIMYVVPGLGTHRLGSSSVALGELAWDRGFSVVMVSNALNFEFAARASSLAAPGHAPIDANDLHDVLDAIDSQLSERFPGRVTERVLMGYSLGAFHVFFIAAAEQNGADERVRFDRYLTLDAPVSLLGGLRKLDEFYNAPLVFPAEQRDVEVRRILYKAVSVGQHLLEQRERYSRSELARAGAEGSWLTSLEIPLTDLEARFLIGFAFRRTLRELIWASQQREDLGVLRTDRRTLSRNPAYREINDYSYEEYLYAFVLPALRERGEAPHSAEALFAANDLRSIEPALRANGRIHHFANSNDFLTSDADEAWLVDVLGSDQVRFFPEGGHLGNLHLQEVQAEIMDAIGAPVRPVR